MGEVDSDGGSLHQKLPGGKNIFFLETKEQRTEGGFVSVWWTQLFQFESVS